jgi:cytochrome d ubiquinol oxidase subunit I
VYAVGLLRGRRDGYHRRGFAAGLAVALVAAPLQVVVGDWAVRAVAANQPAKMAAIEGLARTGPNAPLSVGGVWDGQRLVGAVQVPNGLSVLLHGNRSAVVAGLDAVPPRDRAPVTVTHLSFDLMVGIGVAFLLLGAAAWWLRRRGRDLAAQVWLLRATVAAAPAAVVALFAGWVTTEVGRQPWIVYRLMRTADAVSAQPGLWVFLYATLALYAVLTVTLVGILRRLARHGLGAPDPVPA